MTRPDSDWSEPGETQGVRERYQDRHIGGLTLCAGNNWMEAGRFIVPEAKTPWSVLADITNPHAHGAMMLKLVAFGTATSQAAARDAAEAAARAYLATTAPVVAPEGT